METAVSDATLNRRTLLAAAGASSVAASPARAAAPAGPWTSQGMVARAGMRIHWASLGQGEPVVMLHKLGGWMADWRQLAPLVAARGRRVIALDLPGHGESDIMGPPPYFQSLPESAAIVKTALEEIGVTRFDLVGNSLGGCTGVVLAACWPESVRKLALLSVALSAKSTREAIAKAEAPLNDQYDVQGRPLPRSASQVTAFASSPQVTAEQNFSRARAGVWIRPSERGVALAGVADYLPRIAAPTLLVYAEAGTYRQFEALGRARLRDVRVVRIPNSGSFMHQEQPAATAEVVNAFLAA